MNTSEKKVRATPPSSGMEWSETGNPQSAIRNPQSAEGLSIISVSPQPPSPDDPSESALAWRQFSPRPGIQQKKGGGRLNTASIRVFARSLMAKEWARALGRQRRDPQWEAFERQAGRWRKRR